MGYYVHHAIVVTCRDHARQMLIEAHERAVAIFGEMVSPIVPSPIGMMSSFFVAPDGSKEGWSESDEYDAKRETFANFLDAFAYEDGSNEIEYAEIFYGTEDGTAGVKRHNSWGR
ncbi:MAG: hypothetical protein M0Z85_08130 [Gammaproteobacteria bacterium]|nr:hypothetical protein [Gammaproteobacteria bacterium]